MNLFLDVINFIRNSNKITQLLTRISAGKLVLAHFLLHLILDPPRVGVYSSDIPPSFLESLVEELISSSNSNTSLDCKYNIYYIMYMLPRITFVMK